MLLNETSISLISAVKNSTYKDCFEKYSISRCYLSIYGHNFIYFILAYIFLTFSLVPQIIYLIKYGIRYVAGISYLWIIIRIFALMSLMAGHKFAWSGLMELITLLSTMVIFMQILILPNNFHRHNQILLISISLSIWIFGRILIALFVKEEYLTMDIGYLFFGIQMLPQILLNSLLRTAKAFSKLTILFSAMSDIILFYNFFISHAPLIHLISIYYSFSFFLYMALQNLIYSDAHIHLISRSTHTVHTPGVDLFTGLDVNGTKSHGQEPQMFTLGDLESLDGSDIIYQPVSTNKVAKVKNEQTLMQKIIFHTILALIFGLETIVTMMLIYRVRSPWIIIIPISIFLILSIFFLLRTRLSASKLEFLRKIL